MTAPRLLLVTTVPGTLVHFLAPYATYLRERGWEVDAVTGDGEPEQLRALAAAFDHVWSVPWGREVTDPRNWTVAPVRLRRLLRGRGFDVVHVHTPIAAMVTRSVVGSLARHERPALCYTAHGFHFHPRGRPLPNAVYRTAERVAGRWTDCLLVMNAHDLDEATSRRLVPKGRVVLVPGVGIDLERYRPTQDLLAAAAALRADLGIGPDRVVLSVVAELQPGKDHPTVLRALAADPDLDAVLLCAGRGPQHGAIVEAAAQLGVADRLVMLGSVQDVRPVVLASRATVLASWREGLSRAVLESLALGVPVVGSRVRGIADLVAVPEAGFLVEPGDVTGFAHGVRAAASLPGPVALRSRLEGRLRRYELSSVMAQHERLYGELLAERRQVPVRR